MSNKNHTKSRIIALDLMRGLTILIMVLAHAISFFHNDTNQILVLLKKAGNSVAFITFLFISAVVTYVAYLKGNEFSKGKSIIKRSLILLIVYYLVAILGNIKHLNIPKTLLLIDVPGYTEFLLPFIFFSILTAIFPRVFKKLSESVSFGITIALSLFVGGQLLSTINFPSFLNSYIYLLAGHDEIYRFPLFQYMTVYILGLQWGHFIVINTNNKEQNKKAFLYFAMLLPLILLSLYLFKYQDIDLFNRWPPKIGFLSNGLAFNYFLFFFLNQPILNKLPGFIEKPVLYISRNPLHIYVAHTVIILLYGIFFDYKYSSFIGIACIFTGLLLISILLTYIFNYVSGHLRKI